MSRVRARGPTGAGAVVTVRRTAAGYGAAFAVGILAAAPGAASPEVHLEREGPAVVMDAGLYVPHPPAAVVGVLLDYDTHAAFLGAVDSSRVLDAHGDTLRVWQEARYTFLFSRTYRFELEVVHGDPDRITFQQVAGDLLGYRGSWDAIPSGAGTWLRYRARLDHGLGIPWILGRPVLGGVLGSLLPELAREVDRRAGADTLQARGGQEDTESGGVFDSPRGR